MGSAQALDDDSVVVGWGTVPAVTQFAADGGVRFEVNFSGQAWNYRALRFPWTGRLRTKPALTARPARATTTAYVAAGTGGRRRCTGGSRPATPAPRSGPCERSRRPASRRREDPRPTGLRVGDGPRRRPRRFRPRRRAGRRKRPVEIGERLGGQDLAVCASNSASEVPAFFSCPSFSSRSNWSGIGRRTAACRPATRRSGSRSARARSRFVLTLPPPLGRPADAITAGRPRDAGGGRAVRRRAGERARTGAASTSAVPPSSSGPSPPRTHRRACAAANAGRRACARPSRAAPLRAPRR